MNDDELFHGYRPAEPPPELRARIMSATVPGSARSAKALAERAAAERSPLRDWLPALAAAATIILFSALGYRINADLDRRLTVPDDLRPVEQWGLSADAGEVK